MFFEVEGGRRGRGELAGGETTSSAQLPVCRYVEVVERVD